MILIPLQIFEIPREPLNQNHSFSLAPVYEHHATPFCGKYFRRPDFRLSIKRICHRGYRAHGDGKSKTSLSGESKASLLLINLPSSSVRAVPSVAIPFE
jgi:hypothetical protein